MYPRYEKARALSELGKPQAVSEPEQLYVRAQHGAATAYDPWEKRREFLCLDQADTGALLAFLQTVGLFERDRAGIASESAVATAPDGLIHQTKYSSEIRVKSIWAWRRAIENSLSNLKEHSGSYSDFPARFATIKDEPHVIITTLTFLDSMALTLSVDRALGAKVRKCARPDCRTMFSVLSKHKRKFCCWECGHLEAVRRQRRKVRKARKEQ
jgi:hypothetical protein